jgi:hypothetical protein
MAKLTPAEMARQAICTECGKPLPPRPEKQKGPGRLYCDDVCKRARNARRLTRGSAIIEWAQTWRRNRGSGEIAQASLAQLCNILDHFNAEDVRAARPPADLAAARMLVDKTMYVDRQRRSPQRDERAAEKAVEAEKPDPLAEVLRLIAEGHNDARGLALEALGLTPK